MPDSGHPVGARRQGRVGSGVLVDVGGAAAEVAGPGGPVEPRPEVGYLLG